ncbi:MAG: hypothetical protein HY390_06945, partial [Deltaproteobacteria bacterium]|nr:hypothetical protein [Deltaproteobacteria bacterium]
MMKKVIYGAFGLYILAASQPSFSQTVTNSGRLGGSKVFAAKSLPKGGAALGLEEEYFQSNQIPFDGENHFHATQFFFTYAPFSYTQFFINRKIELTMSQDHDEILSSYVLLPSEIGTLFHYPLHQSFSIGLEPSVTFFNGNKIKAFHGTSPGIRGLTTYTTLFGKERSPIHFNANVQYFMNHSRNLIHKYDFSRLSHPSLYGLSQYYSLNYGLGIEAELPYFTSFIEYSLDHMLRSHIPLFKNPNRLSTGLKIKLSRNSAWMLHLGGDFGFAYKRFTYVTPTPHVKGFAGLHYTFGSQTPRATVESTPLHLQPDTQQQSTP